MAPAADAAAAVPQRQVEASSVCQRFENYKLRATFEKYDGDGDGRMTESEVRLAWTRCSPVDKQAGRPSKEAICLLTSLTVIVQLCCERRRSTQ